MKKEKEKYKLEDATHWLECKHCVSPNHCRDYVMHCLILKKMPNNRLKILVFGDRNLKIEYRGLKPHTRYVDEYRVYPKKVRK